MRVRSGVILAALATLVPALAAAQEAPPPASSPIVIEGVRDHGKQLKNFIRDLTPTTTGQLTRFEIPACPAVFGLSPQQRAFVTGRIRTVAATARVPLAKPGCDPNVIVIVTSNKAALLAALERKHPDYFPAGWGDRRIHDVERDSDPAAAWQFEGLLSTDGLRLSENADPSASDPVDPAGLVAATIATTAPASRLRPPGRRDFMTAILVVQSSALAGLTTTQFADYAAMRTLVRTDPRQLRSSSPDTILRAIDAPVGTAVPLSLTAWDLSFLKAFYASGTNSYATVQRSDIAWHMKKDLDRPGNP
jgi:hypothetical protein